jgi:hypothetical protein
MRHDGADLARRQPGVQRYGDQAGAKNPQVGRDEVDAVGEQQDDPVPRHQTGRGEPLGSPVHRGVELAPGQPPVAVDQRETFTVTLRCVTKNVREIEGHQASLP